MRTRFPVIRTGMNSPCNSWTARYYLAFRIYIFGSKTISRRKDGGASSFRMYQVECRRSSGISFMRGRRQKGDAVVPVHGATKSQVL